MISKAHKTKGCSDIRNTLTFIILFLETMFGQFTDIQYPAWGSASRRVLKADVASFLSV